MGLSFLKNFSLLCLSFYLPGTTLAQLQWSTTTQKFETATGSQVITLIYPVTNSGSYPVTFLSTKTSCGCTTAKVDGLTLQPGESYDFPVAFSTAGRSGNQKTRVGIRTDDKSSNTTLHVEGTIREVVLTMPSLLRWRRSDPPEWKKIEVRVMRDEPLQIEEVHSKDPGFETRLVTIDEGKKYRVEIRPNGTPNEQGLAAYHIRYQDENVPDSIVHAFLH